MDVIEKYLSSTNMASSVQALRDEFCSNSFQEVALAVQEVYGNIIPRLQDLFMEEGTLVHKMC